MDMREHIRESNLIEGITGSLEEEQSMRAWTFLIAQPEPLTHAVIQETQRLVVVNDRRLRADQRGAYRDLSLTNVYIGTADTVVHRPPPWQDVVPLMDDWLNLVPGRTPWRNHADFEDIHPFVDGNGRVGRMVMWLQQMQRDEEPRLFRAADKYTYYAELVLERQVMAAEGLEGLLNA